MASLLAGVVFVGRRRALVRLEIARPSCATRPTRIP